MTLPNNQTTFENMRNIDDEYTGMKIEFSNRTIKNIKVGFYDKMNFFGVLCNNGSFNITSFAITTAASTTVIASTEISITSTSLISTSTTSVTSLSETNPLLATSIDCSLCSDEKTTELCEITFYFSNKTQLKQIVDCYELGKFI